MVIVADYRNVIGYYIALTSELIEQAVCRLVTVADKSCRLLYRKVKVRIACAFGTSVVNYPLTAQRYAFFKQSLVISEVSVLYA